MFTLYISYLPIHLFADSDQQKVNTSNQADVLEHNIMQIEANLTALTLEQYNFTQYTGAQLTGNMTVQGLNSQLEQARQQYLTYMQSASNVSENNTDSRLAYINNMQWITDYRINELKALEGALQAGKQFDYVVAGVNNESIFSVQKELQMVTAYKSELAASQSYWQNIINVKQQILNPATETEEEETETETDNNTGEETNTNNTSEDEVKKALDLERMNKLALMDKYLGEMRSIMNMANLGKTVEQLKSEESDIKDMIRQEVSKARGDVVGKNIQAGFSPNEMQNSSKVSDLTSMLNVNAGEQQVLKLSQTILKQAQQEVASKLQAL